MFCHDIKNYGLRVALFNLAFIWFDRALRKLDPLMTGMSVRHGDDR